MYIELDEEGMVRDNVVSYNPYIHCMILLCLFVVILYFYFIIINRFNIV